MEGLKGKGFQSQLTSDLSLERCNSQIRQGRIQERQKHRKLVEKSGVVDGGG